MTEPRAEGDAVQEHALTVRLPESLYRALKAHADVEERTVAGLLRLLARQYIDRAVVTPGPGRQQDRGAPVSGTRSPTGTVSRPSSDTGAPRLNSTEQEQVDLIARCPLKRCPTPNECGGWKVGCLELLPTDPREFEYATRQPVEHEGRSPLTRCPHVDSGRQCVEVVGHDSGVHDD